MSYDHQKPNSYYHQKPNFDYRHDHRDTPPSLSPDDIIRLPQYHTTAPLHPPELTTSAA
ncbi:hypothetical protein HanXRQr2_Chr02g0048611 [Helianthus annuus]|uniref:Uncharacterized protein n=1 Tax=Helianthus annuus TaxID=4232 RepID=A0A251VCK1_HELAN|nr:hypothetical protein HanXRQr2_Chr02g0048611 [Helianthus annuus]KAJ0613699.1 hypothetical protein HanIR_Chr02g0054331 [Helianthus annuus]KAJ0950417.1 hypothetical protein HanPSC8_Chr02g0048061 [Helianthus annuus]